jgi:uncharacterized NAD(P)/FAD-binding protein YdhS
VPVVAVVGGGASGTLTSVSLLRAAAGARLPLRIALIDRHGRHGRGQAYATEHPWHLLNSPADRMSAVPHDAGSLARWAEANGLGGDRFLPRAAFGRYLQELLADAERAAGPAATVTRITSEVVAVTHPGQHRPLRLHLAADGRIDADVAVLATGNLPPAPPCAVPATPRYVGDPWAPGALDRVADGSQVAILGTGLSMLDVAISVAAAHPRAVVHAVSRHGLLPRQHLAGPAATAGPAACLAVAGIAAGHAGLAGLIRRVRAAAGEAGEDWEIVVDALRPQAQRLWQQLPETEQRAFLRHVARYWEVHRHRVPPATASRIEALRAAGRLTVLRGRVSAVSEEPDGLRVRLEARDGEHGRTAPGAAGRPGWPADLTVGWLVNATGPAADVTATSDRLLRQLLDRGLAAPDPLRLGIKADGGGAVLSASGRPGGTLFTLGPPLRGQLYETTAIPEIRDQAAALATRLVTALRAHTAPESAA